MAFTEFYAQTTGDNLNAGSTTSDAAAFTYAGGTFVRATGVFTVASGNPSSDGVAVGDFASIYTTAGATVATFVGRVTARDATTITVSLSAIAGATSTVSETAAAATCKVGGAWKGPNGTVAFPFAFATSTMTNSSGDVPRVNFKSGTYSPTSAMTHNLAGPVVFEGYYSTVGDNSLNGSTWTPPVIDGSSSSFIVLTFGSSATNIEIANMEFKSTRSAGSAFAILEIDASFLLARRCVVHDCRRVGMYVTGAGSRVLECEAYLCAASNTSGDGAFYMQGTGSSIVRSIAHDNTRVGIQGTSYITVEGCICDTNADGGFATTSGALIKNCDFYNNTNAGINLANSSGALVTISNCNFLKNSTWGINGSGSGARVGGVQSCRFGTGTQANTSGTTTGLKGMQELGSANYATDVAPWTDPANGDFRINLAAAKNAGVGRFLQTQASYSGTIGYPDVGAAQHNDSGGGGASPIGLGSPVIRGR